MRSLTEIIVHCSATKQDEDIGVAEIRQWHLDKGWDDVGYHYVIRRDGTIEYGRPIEIIGAHVIGRNTRSIGICLIGGTDADDRRKAEANFTLVQYQSLNVLIAELHEQHGPLRVLGHRDTGANKACPSFDVRALLGITQ